MNRPHCRGCGEQKRIRWPLGDPMFCSKDCAAGMGYVMVSAAPDAGHCWHCGEIACAKDHSDD